MLKYISTYIVMGVLLMAVGTNQQTFCTDTAEYAAVVDAMERYQLAIETLLQVGNIKEEALQILEMPLILVDSAMSYISAKGYQYTNETTIKTGYFLMAQPMTSLTSAALLVQNMKVDANCLLPNLLGVRLF